MTHAPVFYTTITSPVGDLLLTGTETHLTGLYMTPHTHGPDRRDDWVANDAPFRTVVRQLAEYFDGTRQTFDVALAPHGTTFQQRVWQALSEIPYGTTVSYAHIARAIENPKGVRAVGLANGRNPISIIVPCHRVIGANGSLTGYGGGLPRKEWLLTHESTVRTHQTR